MCSGIKCLKSSLKFTFCKFFYTASKLEFLQSYAKSGNKMEHDKGGHLLVILCKFWAHLYIKSKIKGNKYID